MTTTATDATPPDLLAALRAAWERTECVVTTAAGPAAKDTPAPRRTPQAAPQAAEAVATGATHQAPRLASERQGATSPTAPATATGNGGSGAPARQAPPRICTAHTHPLDAVERPAPGRAGWIRTTCRRCGRFLGYSPAADRRTLTKHG